MQRATLLLVSDDPASGNIWEFALRQLDLDVVLLSSPEEAIEWRAAHASDLIVVDEATREFDGIALVRHLRSEVTAPIILLTGGDHIRSLEAYRAGVDECVVEPISPALFLAKVNAWLRHAATIPMDMLDNVKRGPFQLNPTTQEVVAYDQRVTLTNLEFRLLHLFVMHVNQVLPSQVVIDRVWQYSPGVEGTVLKNAIYRLRRKIEPNPAEPQHIISVTGEGYLFRL